MIKQDIINATTSAAEMPKAKAEQAVEVILDELKSSMARGERIESRGFGVFVVKPRKRGMGRNPRTGQLIPIQPGRTVRFKPSKALAIVLGSAR
jgi:DNA-binding protein HU-beta